ncbi:hypothetical protein ACHAWF_006357, partial [Thalassiosira exigua]
RARRPSSSNWEDEFSSSRNNPDVTGYRPPWRDRDEGAGGGNGNSHSGGGARKEPFQHGFQRRSTDDFKRPHDAPSGGGGGSPPPPPPPPRANVFRHPFQTSSTDEFKRPHGMPAEAETRPPPPWGNVFKSPFQTSTTEDFKRSSDVASGAGAPQQDAYRRPDSRSDAPPWMNDVGRGTFDSTQSQPPPPSPSTRSHPPENFFDAQIINDAEAGTQAQPPQPDPPMTPAQDLEQWDKRLENAQSKSRRMLLRNVRWPLAHDPAGVGPEFPALATRVIVTVLSTLTTWYLHAFNGCSPVMASAATALVVSTCLDRRLGQAALCGSLAGMSGGHLVPDISTALALGGLTSACYELLININNLCLGVGGRLGATAFVATSALARYRHVAGAGRKMRRGLWKSGAGPSNILVAMVSHHVLGSLATIFLREYSDDSAAADPVRASSVVGLLGSLFVRDPKAALALYGGSFVGMSLPSRLLYGDAPGNAKSGRPQTALSLFAAFGGAGAFAGLIHATTVHYGYWNGGWGGKVGLCAFAGCWAYRGISDVVQSFQQTS